MKAYPKCGLEKVVLSYFWVSAGKNSPSVSFLFPAHDSLYQIKILVQTLKILGDDEAHC